MPDYEHSQMFNFRNSRQQKKHDDGYFSRVFPLGEAQKEKDAKLLQQLIATPSTEQHQIYSLVYCRDIFLNNEEEADAQEKQARWIEWYSDPVVRGFSLEDKAVFRALVKLSSACESLEAYPDPDAIRQESAGMKTEMAEWKVRRHPLLKKIFGIKR